MASTAHTATSPRTALRILRRDWVVIASLDLPGDPDGIGGSGEAGATDSPEPLRSLRTAPL